MNSEGEFTVDGTDIRYEFKFMMGDAKPYVVRFQEAPHTWSGNHAFETEEERDDCLYERLDQWVNSHKGED